MTKIKIAHTESSCGWGGQEIRILEESRGMIQRGHTVFLLCPSESTIFSEASKYGIIATPVNIKNKSISSIIQVKNWIQSNSVDIINTHSSTDSWITAVACLFVKSSPQIIRTRHISTPVTNNILNRWLYKHATKKIITTGNSIRNHLISKLGISTDKITSIPTGIDPSRFKPSDLARINRLKKLGLPIDNSHYIGIVATLRSWKGHKYLIDAFSMTPDKNWKLIIIGNGPQMNNISQQIRKLSLNNQILCVGHQENPENWLQILDIFCLPSYANEGVPQSILQAMFSGLPIITTDAGAIGEVIDHGNTGIVVKKKDPQDLYMALVNLMHSKSLRESIGKNALIAAKTHSLNSMLDQVEIVFHSSIRKEQYKK